MDSKKFKRAGRGTTAPYVVGELQVRDLAISVVLTEYGEFAANFQGNAQSAPTIEKLYDQLMAASRKSSARISIPFETFETGRFGSPAHFVESTVVGIHVGTGNLLVRTQLNDTKATTEQRSRWGAGRSGIEFKPLTPEQRREYIALQASSTEIGKKIAEFQRMYGIDLEATAKIEVNKVLDADDDAVSTPVEYVS